MQDFGTKADDTAGPSGQLSAAEFNNLATELENAVLRSGQALSGASILQLATSLFLHGAKSQTFQDSGAANAYVVTPVSGSGGVTLPGDYAAMNGAVVTFKASAANTTASTLNFGQTTGSLLGTKAVVQQDGTALPSGAISAGSYAQVRYDSSIGAGSWVLLPWGRQATETQKGVLEIATQPETDARASDAVSVTPLKLGAGFVASFGANGYIKFPSWLGGFLVQWGVDTGTAGADKTLSFPLAWPTAMRSINGTCIGTLSTSISVIFDSSALTTTSITFRANTASNVTVAQPIYWIAVGV